VRRAALLLLAAAAAAGPKPGVAPADLPVVKKVEDFPELSPFVSVTVELDAEGAFHIGGRPATLNEVDAYVLRTTEQRAIQLRRKGEPGMETLPTGIEASPVHVHLRVHRDAPWRHVQWLLTMLAEQHAYKTGFVAVDAAGKEGIVRAWLPLDTTEEGGVVLPEGDEDETERAPRARPGVVTITLLAEGEKEATYRGETVKAPGAVGFAVGRRKTSDRAKFLRYLADELRGGKVKTVEIRAERRMPVGEVVQAIDEVRAAGHDRVDVYRPLAVPRALRQRASLPYPE